jgi:hypothetical protein
LTICKGPDSKQDVVQSFLPLGTRIKIAIYSWWVLARLVSDRTVRHLTFRRNSFSVRILRSLGFRRLPSLTRASYIGVLTPVSHVGRGVAFEDLETPCRHVSGGSYRHGVSRSRIAWYSEKLHSRSPNPGSMCHVRGRPAFVANLSRDHF